MNDQLRSLLWVAVLCMAVSCQSSEDPDTSSDEESSSSSDEDEADDDDEEDDDNTGSSASRDAGRDAGRRDAGESGDDSEDDDDSASEDDDDDSMSAGSGASADPLCSAEAANECEECGCTECAAEMEACNSAEGEAAEGPQAGTPKSELCRAVVECGRRVGCRGQMCIGTECLEVILAAAELENDPANVAMLIMRAEDPIYAVTLSSAISECTVMKCAEACQ